MLAICDKGCNKEFNLEKLDIEYLDDGVERTHFKCPHCGQDYTAFHTDAAIRNKQKKMQKRMSEKLRKQIAIDMQVLRERMEASNGSIS